jgi:uncharacterized transporter YbjL
MIDLLLGGASSLAAVTAVGVYFWLLFRRPSTIRLFSNFGLFLTGLGLFQGPMILASADGEVGVRLAVSCLVLAVVSQLTAALQTRSVWRGEDRRAETQDGSR